LLVLPLQIDLEFEVCHRCQFLLLLLHLLQAQFHPQKVKETPEGLDLETVK